MEAGIGGVRVLKSGERGAFVSYMETGIESNESKPSATWPSTRNMTVAMKMSVMNMTRNTAERSSHVSEEEQVHTSTRASMRTRRRRREEEEQEEEEEEEVEEEEVVVVVGGVVVVVVVAVVAKVGGARA